MRSALAASRGNPNLGNPKRLPFDLRGAALPAAKSWNEQTIGIALTGGGIAGIIAQTPAGALADRVRSKRALIAGGVIALAIGALMIAIHPSFWSAVTTAVGIGAALSQSIAGGIVRRFGYHAGFLFLAAVTAIAFILMLMAMPETRKSVNDAAIDQASLASETARFGPERHTAIAGLLTIGIPKRGIFRIRIPFLESRRCATSCKAFQS